MEQDRITWHRAGGAGGRAPRPARVLVADDDAAMRDVLVGALQGEHYDVIAVASGAQLVRYFSACILHGESVPLPDVVVSDIRMPGPTGLQVLRGLRECDLALPVVLITGFGEPEVHREAQRLGALAVFDKPFDIDDLRRTVADAVRRRPVR